uniref:Retrotransposon Copia-like N-terminal domain-containing protein n=1 Tax=Salix viminalis TaxID=40686 RepID=A0A6N2N729_SALVM
MESSTSSIPPVSNSNSNSNSSAIQSVSPHLPDISTKLASTNYLLWKAQVVPVLRGNGLLGYVKNQIVCPAQTITSEGGVSQTNPAATTWLRTDQLILGWINSSLTDGPLSQVINCESSHDAWQQGMDEDELIICILRGLGSEFDPIVAALNARDVYPSLEGVIGKLRDFEIRIQAARVVSSNVAFYTFN